MTVTRYNHYVTYDDIPHMEEHTNGEYVKYVDYLKVCQVLNYVKAQRDVIGKAIQLSPKEMEFTYYPSMSEALRRVQEETEALRQKFKLPLKKPEGGV